MISVHERLKALDAEVNHPFNCDFDEQMEQTTTLLDLVTLTNAVH